MFQHFQGYARFVNLVSSCRAHSHTSDCTLPYHQFAHYSLYQTTAARTDVLLLISTTADISLPKLLFDNQLCQYTLDQPTPIEQHFYAPDAVNDGTSSTWALALERQNEC